jgi:hypothetical protein
MSSVRHLKRKHRNHKDNKAHIGFGNVSVKVSKKDNLQWWVKEHSG